MCLDGLSPIYLIASIKTGFPFLSNNSTLISTSGVKNFEPNIWNELLPPGIVSSTLITLKYVELNV